MGAAIGGILPFAVGVAISPFPIAGMVFMLLTPKAKPNGFSFLFGWIAGVAIAGTAFLVVLDAIGVSDDNDEPATWTYWLKLALGLALLLLAVRQWRHRPHPGDEVSMPKWMSALDGFTPAKSVGLAVLLSAVNPKNLIFVVGGAAVVVQADLSVGDEVIVWASSPSSPPSVWPPRCASTSSWAPAPLRSSKASRRGWPPTTPL